MGADIVFKVGSETFAAHRCMLAAQSPVFSAELFGSMKESDREGVVIINDIDAQVFKALLRFMYTDSLPEMEEEAIMCEHLLVAADRYNLRRLKLICEDRLCSYIGIGNVGNILALADQHHCDGLKKACFDFLRSHTPANVMSSVMALDGFDHLSKSYTYAADHGKPPITSPPPPSPLASAIVDDTVTGYHLLIINSYLCTKMMTPNGKALTSSQLTVGGHRWRIRYYPNGDNADSAD
uniref:BTB domain-containing protein n=1 Tax=Leersia perrieri TaxID=77586 RepID=A0A0D9XJW0_9ORYZ